MSTRYVWGQYTRETQYDYVTRYRDTSKSYSGDYDIGIGNSGTFTASDSGCSLSTTTGRYSYRSSSTYTHSINQRYYYISLILSGSTSYVYADEWRGFYGFVAGSSQNGLTSEGGYVLHQSESYIDTVPYYVQGSFIAYLSSSNSSAYPSNSYTGSYWYVSEGSDNIDAVEVILPAEVKGGEDMEVQVTPSNSKKYGGNITYTIEYNFGSGWQSYGQLGEYDATSFTINVPWGSESAQVRVKAKDDLGFTSSTYTISNQATVDNNDPPTAPGNITVTNVTANNAATISITAATDPDGEVVNYEWGRSIDGNAYSVLQTTDANTLSITDNIGVDWGTVTYRVRAKDDYGEWGPYAVSNVYTVNEGILTIASPSYSLGMLVSPFYYTFSIGITGEPISTNEIHAVVYLDNKQIYEATNLERDESVSVPIDPRLLSATTHSILIVASKEGYTTTEQSSDFYIEGISAPAGGIIEQLQNSAGQAVLPYTLGQCVIGRDGKDFNTLLEETEAASLKIESGSYSGSGVYGQYNPNTISTSFFPKMFTITDATGSSSLVWTGSPSVNGITINATSSGITWYGDSAANQFNSSGQSYYYTVIG